MSLCDYKEKFNQQIKAQKNHSARISADKFIQGRELTKKITLLEDEVVQLRHKQELAQGEIDATVTKAVTEARQSERRLCSSKNRKLTSKLAVAKKETKVSKGCPITRSLNYFLSLLALHLQNARQAERRWKSAFEKFEKERSQTASLSTDESFLLQSRVLRTPRELRMIDALLTRVVVVHPTASMQHFASMICRLNANPTTGRGELFS